jgi:hypothetical protein
LDREPFVFGERIDDAAHEHSFGCVGVWAAIDGTDGRPEFLDALFDERGDQGVACQSIPCGHEQDAGAVLLDAGKRCAEAGVLISWSGAADSVIGKEFDLLGAVRRAPRE